MLPFGAHGRARQARRDTHCICTCQKATQQLSGGLCLTWYSPLSEWSSWWFLSCLWAYLLAVIEDYGVGGTKAALHPADVGCSTSDALPV